VIRLKRRRTGAHVPGAFREPKLTQGALKLIDIYYAAQQPGGKFEFDSAAWKPAKNALKKDSGNKCAYCEASTAVVAHGDVEHFRPKSEYWWLALAFDNYLFSCQICNQTYKKDHFPIRGAKCVSPPVPPAKPGEPDLSALARSLVLDATATDDAALIALWNREDPELINPYFEDPEPLFSYRADDAIEEIWVESAGGERADRALKASSDFLGLNREELRRDRYAHYLPFAVLKAVLDELAAGSLRDRVVADIRRQQAQQQPFAGMKRYFARQWTLPGPL
jgi:hypothetical protein